MLSLLKPIATAGLLAGIAQAPQAQSHSQSDLVQNQIASFDVTGSQPGDFVLMFYGLAGLGQGFCVPPPIDLCLGIIDTPRFFQLQVADANGFARVQIQVPETMPMVSVASQAFVATPRSGDEFSFALTNAVESRVLAVSSLSDNFNGSVLDPSWDIHKPEAFDSSVAGGKLIIENSSFIQWFADGEGQMVSKLVTGDFSVICKVRTEDTWNPGQPPPPNWHLGGLIVRDPASTAGRRNWLHLVIGSGSSGTPIALEDKTTRNSSSTLNLTPLAFSEAELRIDRIGAEIVMYYRIESADPWILVRSFDRGDFPSTLQVGMGLSGTSRVTCMVDSIFITQ